MREPDKKFKQSFSGKFHFSNKLFCGECGMPVVRRRLTSTKNGERYYFSAWQCRETVVVKKNSNGCRARYIWESSLEEAFMKMLYELKVEDVLTEANEIMEDIGLNEMEKQRLKHLEAQYNIINERLEELTKNAIGANSAIYEATTKQLKYEQGLLQTNGNS